MPVHRRRAFTVVELLVVVGLIGVLLAILLPALAGVRRQAHGVVCLSNLRQLGGAFHLYTRLHNGHSIHSPGISTAGNGTVAILHFEDVLIPGRARGQQLEIMFCPETDEAPVRIRGNGDKHYWYPGGVRRPWGMPDGPMFAEHDLSPFRGSSYAFNAWLSHVGKTTPFMDSWYLPHAYLRPGAKEASSIPVFGDGTWATGWPWHTDGPPRSLSPHRPDPVSIHRIYSMSTIFCIPRHGRAINLVFLDGRAARVPLAELWKLKWTSEWVPRDVTLPPR